MNRRFALSNPQRAFLYQLRDKRAVMVPGTKAMTARALEKAGLIQTVSGCATITEHGRAALQFKTRKYDRRRHE